MGWKLLSSLKYRLIILDRDGVLNVRNRLGYILNSEEFIFPEDLNRVKEVSMEGIAVAVATNQQCVGLGLISIEEAVELSQIPLKSLGIANSEIYLCPHLASDNCECRKPKPGLIQQALIHAGIEKGQVLMIGDSISDMQAAENAGIDFMGVCWDGKCLGDVCCHTLSDAVDRILATYESGV
jgi:D-glycero-D-manno-heptose 1,7-bisphosphate phosphatase